MDCARTTSHEGAELDRHALWATHAFEGVSSEGVCADALATGAQQALETF
jgi:hypothetical protein